MYTKQYKITFGLGIGSRYHMILRENDTFFALYLAIQELKNTEIKQHDIKAVCVEEIGRSITLTPNEIRFLVATWKSIRAKPRTMYIAGHPRWLARQGVVKCGYHEKGDMRAFVKYDGDWMEVNAKTGKLEISDKSRIIAKFYEWGDVNSERASKNVRP